MAKTRVLAGRVGNDIYDRILEICSKDGTNPNDVVKNALDGYVETHDKLAHPEKAMPKAEYKHLEIKQAEPKEEINTGEFVKEMWDGFVSYAKEQGHTLIKTEHLAKLLDVIELRKDAKPIKEDKDFTCGKCEAILTEGAKFCPSCGVELNWDDVSG